MLFYTRVFKEFRNIPGCLINCLQLIFLDQKDKFACILRVPLNYAQYYWFIETVMVGS